VLVIWMVATAPNQPWTRIEVVGLILAVLLPIMFFPFSRTLWLALPCLVVAGFGFMVQMAASNTIIQTIVDDAKRGRVMSFYMMAFLGTAPFGSLMAGWLSSRIGAPHTLLVGGISCLAGAAWFAFRLPALRTLVRPIYVDLGILPQLIE